MPDMDVSAPAPDPIALLGSPDSTATIQPAAAPPQAPAPVAAAAADPSAALAPPGPTSTVTNPGSAAGLDAQQQVHHGMLGSVLDAVGDALGGSKTVTLTRNAQTGKMEVASRDATEKEKWGRAAAIALKGMAAGYAVPNGPGVLGRAAAAGVGSGVQSQQQMQQGKVDNANDEYNAQQQAQVHNANMALSQARLHESQYDLNMKKAAFIQGNANRQNDTAAMLQEAGPGSTELPTTKNIDETVKLSQSDPDLIKDHANGRLYSLPQFDADGNQTGMRNFRIDQAWGDRMNTKPVNLYRMAPDPKAPVGSRPIMTPVEIPAGSMSNKNILLAQQTSDAAANAAANTWHDNDVNDAKEKREGAESKAKIANLYSEANEHNATAGKTKTETANLKAGPDSPNGQTGMRLVENLEDPTQISMRAKDREAKFDAANQYSMAKYGEPFDPAQAQTDYKYANNPGTKNTLNYITSLVGQDGKGGNLGTLKKLSATLPRTQFPALNDVAQWAKLQAGDPRIVAYHTAAVETADQFAKILQGGGSGGGTSDAKMKQGLELFKSGFNNDQINAVASTAGDLLHSRKTGIIGNNSYLMKEYQPDAYQARQAARVAKAHPAQPATAPVAGAPAPQGVPAPAAAPAASPGAGFNWGAHPVAK